jgi:hypothetical protein
MTGCVNMRPPGACMPTPCPLIVTRPQASNERVTDICDVRARPGEAGCLTLREAKQPRRREANGALAETVHHDALFFFFVCIPASCLCCVFRQYARRGHVHRHRIHAPVQGARPARPACAPCCDNIPNVLQCGCLPRDDQALVSRAGLHHEQPSHAHASPARMRPSKDVYTIYVSTYPAFCTAGGAGPHFKYNPI